MDFLKPILTVVAGCLPIGSLFKYIWDYETIKEALRRENQALSDLQSIVQDKVQRARNNGKAISDNVKKWLEEVKTTVTEVSAWLTSTDDMPTSCGSFPDCYKRYKLSNEAQRRCDTISSLIQRGENFSRSSVSHHEPAKGIDLLSNSDFTAFGSITTSLNETSKALDRNSKVGVLGTGGIGKTTMVREIGRVAKEQNIFDQVVFVVVTQTVDIKKIQSQLGDQLGLNFSKETENGRAYELRNRIKFESKILVILDDVWNRIDLFDVGIPYGDEHKGCKILLTTRREQVCNSMELEETIKLNFLNEDEAWQLFSNNVRGRLNDPSPELKVVAKEVIRECGGLPLALVAVAGALLRENVEEWRLAVERLQKSELPEIDTIDRNVYACLKLSYDYLKSDAAKKCFLLCSLFPEDHEIIIEELAKYAMGFGLFQDASTFKSVKARVRRIIKDLKESSLLLNSNMADHVKIHDVVRDAALWIASKCSEEVFLVPIPSHINWMKDPKLKNSTAISLLSCSNNEFFPCLAESPRLKMLLLAQGRPLRNVVATCFTEKTALRVLDMTAIRGQAPPELVLPSSIKFLNNLQVLYLRGWTLKGDMSMIGTLKKLEILSFNRSLLKQLPKELLELTMLMILDFSACRIQEGYDANIIAELFLRVEELHPPNNHSSPESDED